MAIDDLDDEENAGTGNSDNLSEADDSFGLPEVEYQPLEEGSEDSHGYDDDREEALESDNDSYAAQEQGAYQEGTYGADYESEGGMDYEPDSYEPKYKESSLPIIITLILVFLIAGGVLGYLFWWKPMKNKEQYATLEKEGKELLAKNKWDEALKKFDEALKLGIASDEELKGLNKLMTNAKRARSDAREAKEIAEKEALAAEGEGESEAPVSSPVPQEPGTIETISGRTGRYHVVVASSFDGDLANDYAKKLAKEGKSVKIIEPYGKKKFFRVAVASFDDLMAAEAHSVDLKSEFGNDTWIMKY